MTIRRSARVAAARTKAEAAGRRGAEDEGRASISSAKDELTFGGLLDLYEDLKVWRKNVRKLASLDALRLLAYLGEHLDRPATAFTDDDCLAMRDAIVMAGSRRRRTNFLAYSSRSLKWAREEKRSRQLRAGVEEARTP